MCKFYFLIAFSAFVWSTKASQIKLETVSFDKNAHHLQLKYYELIKVKQMKRKVRSAALSGSKELSFSAFGRDFHLILCRNKRLLSSRFRAFVINSFGVKRPFQVDLDEFYNGSVVGKSNGSVSAHLDSETGLLTASIHVNDENDVYFVEPFWRHVKHANDINKHSDTLIVYRASDVLHPSTLSTSASFCESVTLANTSRNESSRRRRDVDSDSFWKEDNKENEVPKSRCSLLLVADYLFYKNVGAKSVKHTINYLIALIGRINVIYTQTTFADSETDEEVFKDVGFIIEEIRVDEEPSSSGIINYNVNNHSWNAADLLDVFSRNKDHESFCLAHLFTYRDFHPTQGMAYVASPKSDAIGGICSLPEYRSDAVIYPNSGFTSSLKPVGPPMTTSEVDMVTAHELGHSWGAQHDPDIPECSPTFRNGGSFIMYYYTITGRERNNKFFSPCSRRSIKAVLKSKSRKCFIKPHTSFCGNGIVEEGEECDAALITTGAVDECCTYECKLKLGARCSDKNYPCCNRCQFVAAGTKCRDENKLDCKAEAYCSGSSAACPQSGSLEDGSDCLDRGRCVSGSCQPFCETKKLHSCLCDNFKDACKRCCSRSLSMNDTCVPYEEIEILSDGTPCVRGICEGGVCKHIGKDMARRIWSIIQNVDVNAFALLMKDNIVATLIGITAIPWIIVCCCIKRYDRNYKMKERRKKMCQQRVRLVHNNNRGYDRYMPQFRVEVYDESD